MSADAVAFTLGQKVYLIADPEDMMGIVTGIMFRETGHSYEVSWGDRTTSDHFASELSPVMSNLRTDP